MLEKMSGAVDLRRGWEAVLVMGLEMAVEMGLDAIVEGGFDAAFEAGFKVEGPTVPPACLDGEALR